ncbi:MAG: TIGR04255 family protein [Chloroflexi bacterium]|nr:TIGR04255 family protein [Chloroflexota bacterium]
MARRRHLKNAPITEAVVELRISPRGPSARTDIKQLASLPGKLAERYPRSMPVRTAKFGFSVQGGQPTVAQPQDLGVYAYRFESGDGKQIVLFRSDGFSFSRLKPYTEWTKMLSEAQELWKVYKERVNPESVTRIAARYINSINIQLPIDDFKDYLNAPPLLPKSAPQSISGFLTRVMVHEPSRDLNATITQAMERGTEPNTVNIILDVDAYKLGHFVPESKELWTILGQLRNLKNTIFFGSITEKTARLFE